MSEQQPTLTEIKHLIDDQTSKVNKQFQKVNEQFQKVYKFLEYIGNNTDDVRASVAIMKEHPDVPINSSQWKTKQQIQKRIYDSDRRAFRSRNDIKIPAE